MSTPIKKQGFSLENATFYLSLILLAATVGAFFYLQNLNRQANDELAAVSAQAAKTKTEEQKNLEARVLSAQRKLEDFSKKLDERRAGTEFFNNFEALVLPEVYFSECNADMKQLKIKLTGHAKTFQSLGQQVSMFYSANNILENIDLEKVSINEDGGIDFSLNAGIKQEMVAFK